jgi:hypothetical protein
MKKPYCLSLSTALKNQTIGRILQEYGQLEYTKTPQRNIGWAYSITPTKELLNVK